MFEKLSQLSFQFSSQGIGFFRSSPSPPSLKPLIRCFAKLIKENAQCLKLPSPQSPNGADTKSSSRRKTFWCFSLYTQYAKRTLCTFTKLLILYSELNPCYNAPWHPTIGWKIFVEICYLLVLPFSALLEKLFLPCSRRFDCDHCPHQGRKRDY